MGRGADFVSLSCHCGRWRVSGGSVAQMRGRMEQRSGVGSDGDGSERGTGDHCGVATSKAPEPGVGGEPSVPGVGGCGSRHVAASFLAGEGDKRRHRRQWCSNGGGARESWPRRQLFR